MSSASASATPTLSIDGNSAGSALRQSNMSLKNFWASLSTATVIFGIQIGVFLILSGNLKFRGSAKAGQPKTHSQSLFHRIYYYKTSFVSKSKQVDQPSSAYQSFKTVFTLSGSKLIRIAGVDGYLFLRYLQLLLKIFVPMACVILPILLPVNRAGNVANVSGMDSFGWTNAGVPKKVDRLWAHLVLALLVIAWSCYQFYVELRKFIRLRQTVLTQPEHRIRASATTILVQSIPRKWLTVPALDALYDVFPGGLREIWINRNYDDLQEKISMRTNIARNLENAETDLIINCYKKHKDMEAKRDKKAGIQKAKKERKREEKQQNQDLEQAIDDPGMTSGNPHQIEHALQELLNEEPSGSSSSSRASSPDAQHNRPKIPIVGQGLQAVGHGIRDVGVGVGKIGSKVVGGFKGAFGREENMNPASNSGPEISDNNRGRSSGQDQNHFTDGADDRAPESGKFPSLSPTDSEFGNRGPSTESYTPLNASVRHSEKSPVESGPEESFSPEQSPTKAHPPTTKKDHFKALKDSRINPLRRKSDFASPQPFRIEGDEFPLKDKPKSEMEYDYTAVFKEESAEDDEHALWRRYIKPSDRDTMRVPLFNKSWWPSIPLIGKKVDTIYYCRKELARLNYEISQDQANPEQYPLMNSAFIQFNHQVAAHMACQSLSHHIPRQMAPRTVEVDPKYVLWDNLSIKWWERYLRTGSVVVIIAGLVICWGFPVTFTGLLSQLSYLTGLLPWLNWINKLPLWVVNFIQGVLPPLFLAILFAILPLLMRFLASFSGVTTAGDRELRVQNFYFAFVFIQLFLVVSISAGITRTIKTLIDNPVSIPATLAKNLPGASNYFFSYLILQALSISSGTLLQVVNIVMLFLGRFLDTTARQKVTRVLSGSGINWGTLIPVYTNFGAIGLIYSVISPLILLFMILTFGLFWFTYRYQMIYVSFPIAETNGLIFPRAINQLFTGLYFMELCLIGLFFLARDENNKPSCIPQAIIMIIAMAGTVAFQILVNNAFGPLYKYLPITFEDDAVVRDEEFQRAQASRWGKKDEDEEGSEPSINDRLEEREKREERENEILEEQDLQNTKAHRKSSAIEMKNISSRMSTGNRLDIQKAEDTLTDPTGQPRKVRKSWADRSTSHDKGHGIKAFTTITSKLRSGLNSSTRPIRDIEAQTNPEAYLFTDTQDALEDIEPEARQKIIKRAFQHPATRAIQPAIWIPHDDVGIAADEIKRTARYTNHIWITSKNARLDAKAHVMFKGLPPDWDPFDNMEI
ncbi:DUF221-domain-containing protein [Lepidopterella palustris CBS 459.81]|uniref:DUF221-domain-containing protein n=1 Tax=Lepidopterella palustris CBS 459.81 TaxID=1314670 RepID=A0A8E2EI13_9PEZI|nr:DUF221-domain-containing protein [Lepidopterella palustris CBS 459.81]